MAELLSSIGMFFVYLLINPLLYISCIVIFLLSLRRIKREREAFHTRVYAQVADWTIPFFPALITGALLSVITGAVGVVLPKEFLGLLVIFSILFVLTCQVRLMTPVYVCGMMLILYGFEFFLKDIAFLHPMFDVFANVPMYVIALLLALFVVAEGTLIRMNGVKFSSPNLLRSKRGKWIGSHEIRRLWVVPILFFIPDGLIPSGGYWPIFTFGDSGWQPILFPFLLGFQQQVKAALPQTAIHKIGRRVTALGFILLLLAIGCYYLPSLLALVGFVAIVGREWLSLQAKKHDEKESPFFATRKEGCVVLGVLPGSPAEKMGIAVGETITKVNGQAVDGEESFYQALQKNSAFCKLHVLNLEGEIRFAQGAVYDGEHHQLGVLLVKDEVTLQNSIV